MYFRRGDNIPREAIKSKHSRSGRTDDIDGRIRGTEHCSRETVQGEDREGHRKADRKLLRADTRSQYHRGNRDVCARVRAGATHRNPRCAHRTYAEILLRHYRGQLCSLDMARNIVIYCALPRKTKTVQCNTLDCLSDPMHLTQSHLILKS